MQAVNTNWQPINSITTPLAGTPSYVNSGIIKAVMRNGERVSVGQIDYQEFCEEDFQYVISPYWDIIDGLPASVFQGIPGINMDLRLEHYYRVNYIPTFIAERTPSEKREDLWELLEEVGLDYYDRFEWLLRTKMRSANDNLIVERKREGRITAEFTAGVLSTLQYGDKVVVDSLEVISNTTSGFADYIFTAVTNGIDIVNRNGQMLIETGARTSMVSMMMAQRMIRYRERLSKRQEGIKQAGRDGKYKGRKPIDVDMTALRQIVKELDEGLITIEEAMRRSKLPSRSTFYRKIKQLRDE